MDNDFCANVQKTVADSWRVQKFLKVSIIVKGVCACKKCNFFNFNFIDCLLF